MNFGCICVGVLKCYAVNMHFRFLLHPLLLCKLAKLTNYSTWYMYGIYHVYVWNIPCIYHILMFTGFEGWNVFLKISGVDITLYSPMAWIHSNRIRKKKRKEQFNIQGISMVYTMYIPALGNIHGISMIYTMDIPYIIFIGVPDEESFSKRKVRNWNLEGSCLC